MSRDPFRYFRVEARELLDQLASGALALEKGGGVAAHVSGVLRVAHTLKGAARVVRQREIADLAHAIEDALAPFRDREGAVPRESVNAVLSAVDAIGVCLASIPAADGGAIPTVPSAREAHGSVRTELAEVDALIDGLARVRGEYAVIRRSVATTRRIRAQAGTLVERLARRAPGAARPDLAVRVAAEELYSSTTALERSLSSSVELAERELHEVRELTERMRLLPAASMFNRLERTVRDAAFGDRKRVVFEARGGDVGLDGHVLDGALVAMIQIVRNAVVHGIELESERRAAGKPPEGQVVLDVTRRGHWVSLRCADDGRGVDLVAVRGAAQRRGELPRGAKDLDAAALMNLLLKGGISTSGAVTQLSGRGVGLDVVRDVAERLGGHVVVETHAGTGTVVELRLPVSRASVESLTAEVDGEVVAVPLVAVRGTRRVAPRDVSVTQDGEMVVHDAGLLRLVTFGRVANGSWRSRGRPFSVVIVRGARGEAAFAVDRLIGTETLTLRPLPALAGENAVLAGVDLDAEGNPRLVLDPDVLTDPHNHGQPGGVAAPPPARSVLVIDDSLTTRMLEQSILETAGYQVDVAMSGEDALDKARRKQYALFLVDVEMPGMDGFAFIESTRADAGLRTVPCILVTSRESAADRERGRAVGASAYVVKSEFDQIDFLDRVRTLVGA